MRFFMIYSGNAVLRIMFLVALEVILFGLKKLVFMSWVNCDCIIKLLLRMKSFFPGEDFILLPLKKKVSSTLKTVFLFPT